MPGHSRILMLSTVANTDLNRQKYHLNFHKTVSFGTYFLFLLSIKCKSVRGEAQDMYSHLIEVKISKFGTHLQDSFF